jgi:hypothetical protein
MANPRFDRQKNSAADNIQRMSPFSVSQEKFCRSDGETESGRNDIFEERDIQQDGVIDRLMIERSSI